MIDNITNWEDIIDSNETKHIKCNGADFYKAIERNCNDISFNKCYFTIGNMSTGAKSKVKYIKFSDCVFHSDCILNLSEVDKECFVDFKDCTFNKDFKIEIKDKTDYCKADIAIKNCMFNNRSLISCGELNFDMNPTCLTTITISDNVAKYSIEIGQCSNLDCFINGKNDRIDIKNVRKLKLHTQEDNAIEHLSIVDSEIVDDIECINCKLLNMGNVVLNGTIKRSNRIVHFASQFSIFNKLIEFSDWSTINVVHMVECTFNANAVFTKVDLQNIDFDNCTFNKTLKIYNLKGVLEKVSFQRSTIRKFLLFNGYDQALNVSSECEVDFSHLSVESSGHVIIRHINDDDKICKGDINFEYANIIGTVTVQEAYFNSFSLDKSTIVGYFNYEDVCLSEDASRATYQRIKNEFVKKNDFVNTLSFKSKEYSAYRKELWRKIVNHESYQPIDEDYRSKFMLYILRLKIYLRSVAELLVLACNTLSSNNGISWVRGIVFTILTAAFFFTCINFHGLTTPIFEWGWRSWDSFGIVWSQYLKILNVLNFNDNLDGFSFTPMGDTLFLISKIFISYGLYQTVSAFRKYGK